MNCSECLHMDTHCQCSSLYLSLTCHPLLRALVFQKAMSFDTKETPKSSKPSTMGGRSTRRRPNDVKIPSIRKNAQAARDTLRGGHESVPPSPLSSPPSPINRSYSTSSLRKAMESPPLLPKHLRKQQQSTDLKLRQSELGLFQNAQLPPPNVQFTPAGAQSSLPAYQSHARRRSQQRGERSPYPGLPAGKPVATSAPKYNEEALAKLEGRQPKTQPPKEPLHGGPQVEGGFVNIELNDRKTAHAETLARLEGRHVQLRPNEGRRTNGDAEAQVARDKRHCSRPWYWVLGGTLVVGVAFGVVIYLASNHK